ncbi:MAG: GatB/YqeY domain-containing protein, partial [Kiritimatiellae bacterium]|nr:GatB/YqeY domain-containing protein [Kiritimatiellia bacterium]
KEIEMASETYDKLMNDLKGAMKARDMVAVNAIRGVIAKAKDLTVNAGKEMTDDAVLAVLAKGAKQREESIAQFEQAGRADLAANEKAELELLRKYLPRQLSEDEVAAVVKQAVAELGATSKKDMGRVMKDVMVRVKGQADGKLVSKLVGAALP